MSEQDSREARCELCGEPMPPGEEMFKYHGYSGDCPKPPLPKPAPAAGEAERLASDLYARADEVEREVRGTPLERRYVRHDVYLLRAAAALLRQQAEALAEKDAALAAREER